MAHNQRRYIYQHVRNTGCTDFTPSKDATSELAAALKKTDILCDRTYHIHCSFDRLKSYVSFALVAFYAVCQQVIEEVL